MFKAIAARRLQGHRTIRFPDEAPVLPEAFCGRPEIDPARCAEGCAACVEACPTDALQSAGSSPVLDLGRCLFCGACASACETDALHFGRDYRMAVRSREALLCAGKEYELARSLDEKAQRLFGRSLKLRQVSAGGCNACEADVNVLGTVVFDLGRFGVQIVASPRHADGLLITGPVSQNMRLALLKTWEAVPPPRLLIAAGACAISGGPYAGHPEVCGGVEGILPIDLYIPGCPPHPITILDGLLRLLDRIR